jgi:hypothetical protein
MAEILEDPRIDMIAAWKKSADRTETAITQARSFLVTRLATEAQLSACRLDTSAHMGGLPQIES